ncbi:MAG: hypothetical protein MUF07_06575 [Steroidobacteraceae bacterium]|nr:hypothetical protein [Steroidobacteraceae bacterium]
MRLTAADRPGVAQPVPVRDVPPLPWPRLLLAALLLAVTLTAAWEACWRSQGAVPAFRDDAALWTLQRDRIDRGEGDATVLVGSSRSFFDVQLPVWERLGGRRPVQLSLVGTSPLFALEDLADDPEFRGALLVDVAPDLFFTGFENKSGFAEYRAKQSPSERVGKWLSMTFVEPYLAFYHEDYALFPVLRRQPWPQRPGVRGLTAVRRLEVIGRDRATHMWARVEDDPEYRELTRRIWTERFQGRPGGPDGATPGQVADRQVARAAAAVAKLRARGVHVLFVRHPTGGDYLAFERRAFPRTTTWDPLLARTGAPGIHFEDHPGLEAGLEFPEWSHMSRASAERYTERLYRLIEREHPRPDGRRW